MKKAIQHQNNLMQIIKDKANVNIVTCGNCGSVLLHELNAEQVTCYDCNTRMQLSDCPDLFNVTTMEAIDYFEILADYNSLPTDQQQILKQVYDLINEPNRTWTPIIQQGDASYKGCADLLDALEEIGWTCDYGLDGQPIELKPL